jgi:hypothetical protein
MKKGMPGPGQYGMICATKDKYATVPKYSIAGGMKDTKEWGSFPGPGQYAPNHSEKTLPKWGFGSEPRLHGIKESRAPGPGQYETRGGLSGSSYSVASRPDGSSKRSSTPGPGQYKPDFASQFESPCKPSFGASSRGELQPSKTPGPGQYDSQSALGGNCTVRSPAKVTILGKREQPKTDSTPGPGRAPSQFCA